jgi:gliding motility-associated-like protein
MLWSPFISAHHLVGGELTYECLGYNAATDEYTYQINLIVYLNCNPNIDDYLDTNVTIDVFRNNEIYKRLFVEYKYAGYIDTQVNDSCFTNPDVACVQKVEYITEVDLKFDGGYFDIAFQRCCRIGSLKNIENPVVTGMTLTSHIPLPTDGICNSSPVFNQLPPAFLCLGDEFELDFSASDPDGDQLVYSLCTPLVGASSSLPIAITPDPPPYFEITWVEPYSAEFPFEANPLVALDPITGLLTGESIVPGIYIIGICASEYRNGELIGETKRDYEVFIYNCLQPISLFAEQSAKQLCDGYEITFANNSLNVIDFLWDFGVDDLQSDTSAEFEPTFLFPDSGTYEVMLIAGPYTTCADTSYHTFFISPQTTVDFNFTGPNCGDEITYSFVPFGPNLEGDFFWIFEEDIVSDQVFPPDINFEEAGNNEVFLIYEIDGCFDTVIKNVFIIPEVVAGIKPQLDSCIGLELILGNQSQNASSYEWFIEQDNFSIVSTQFEPVIPVPFEGDYSVKLISKEEGACPDSTLSIYSAYPLMYPEFSITDDTLCFDNNSTNFNAGGAFQSEAAFLWEFGVNSNIEQSTSQNVLGVQFSETGSYPVSLTISENICIRTFIDTIIIYPNPVALFNISDTSGCIPVLVQFTNISSAETTLDYSWSFGEETFSSDISPFYNFSESGNYFVDLIVNTTNGCVDQVVYQFPITIDVFPVPNADFKIDPSVVFIEDSEVNITNMSQGETNVLYIINDIDTVVHEDFKYSFDSAGDIEIMLFVENNFGCIDSTKKVVSVNGFIFYMPNAFTPDNDGVNDVLIPVVQGVTAFQMKIFNRWGELNFISDNALEGWDGNGAEVGVYNYLVILSDINNKIYKFSGSILLLR